MNISLKLQYAYLALSLALGAPAFCEQSPSQITTKPKEDAQTKETSFLFVLAAEKGDIVKSDEGYKLILNDVDDEVLLFSDRPVRKAGFIKKERFFKIWSDGNDSFKDNPPNAAIIHSALTTNQFDIAGAIPIILINPTQTEKGWEFEIKNLDSKIPTGTIRDVYLFIDGGCGSGFNLGSFFCAAGEDSAWWGG